MGKLKHRTVVSKAFTLSGGRGIRHSNAMREPNAKRQINNMTDRYCLVEAGFEEETGVSSNDAPSSLACVTGSTHAPSEGILWWRNTSHRVEQGRIVVEDVR